jgi:hypothetical protein
MDMAMALLPEPLSPTTATRSPRSMAKETPSTALTVPVAVWNSVRRLRSSSKVVLTGAW